MSENTLPLGLNLISLDEIELRELSWRREGELWLNSLELISSYPTTLFL